MPRKQVSVQGCLESVKLAFERVREQRTLLRQQVNDLTRALQVRNLTIQVLRREVMDLREEVRKLEQERVDWKVISQAPVVFVKPSTPPWVNPQPPPDSSEAVGGV